MVHTFTLNLSHSPSKLEYIIILSLKWSMQLNTESLFYVRSTLSFTSQSLTRPSHFILPYPSKLSILTTDYNPITPTHPTHLITTTRLIFLTALSSTHVSPSLVPLPSLHITNLLSSQHTTHHQHSHFLHPKATTNTHTCRTTTHYTPRPTLHLTAHHKFLNTPLLPQVWLKVQAVGTLHLL